MPHDMSCSWFGMRIMETEVGKIEYIFYGLGQFGIKCGNFVGTGSWVGRWTEVGVLTHFFKFELNILQKICSLYENWSQKLTKNGWLTSFINDPHAEFSNATL